MSRSIDERIVEMRFDNQQFERGVQTTMSTLDKLKSALKFEGITKGFDNINKASKGVDLSSIVSGVDALQKRFSTLGIIGMQVVQNLTTSFMNFAKNGIGSITGAIIEGGKKRAFNIENAHFQLQGLLKDEEKVQAVMADAMESVDGTAYAYDEAAKAASQFAASGLQAGEEMLGALKGITGVAAMTNSEYEGISRIFTTVAGNGRLMGDQLLQLSSRGLNAASTLADFFNGVKDGSIKTSKEVEESVKKLSKGTKTVEADIREMVSDGEISFKIFAAAMDDAFGEHAKKANETFTGAMSNVKAALSRIGAEFISPLIVQNGPIVQMFNALRVKINDVKKAIGPFANTFVTNVVNIVNSMKDWIEGFDIVEKYTVRSKIAENMSKIFKIFQHSVGIAKNLISGLGTVIKPISQAIKYFIPYDVLSKIADFTVHIHRLTLGLGISEETSRKVNDTFRGLISVFMIVKQAVSAVWQVFGPTNEELKSIGSTILDVTSKWGRWAINLNKTLQENNTFVNALQKFKSVLEVIKDKVVTFARSVYVVFSDIRATVQPIVDKVTDKIKELVDAFKDFASQHFKAPDLSALEGFSERVNERFAPLKKVLEVVKAIFRNLGNALKDAAPILAKWGNSILDTIGKFADAILKVLNGEGFDSLIDLFNGAMFTGIMSGMAVFITNLTKLENLAGGAINKWSGIGGNINRVLITTKNSLLEFQAVLKAEVLIRIATAIAILAGSLLILSMIDSNKLAASLAAISVLFYELSAAMKSMSGIFSDSNGIAGIIDATKLNIAMSNMIKMAAAILILSFALKKIGELDLSSLVKGLIGVQASMQMLVMAFNSIDSQGVTKTGAAMILMATGLVILSGALKIMASMNLTEMLTALATLAGSMMVLVMVFNELGNTKTMSTAASMIVIATALTILGGALKIMGSLNIEQLVTALAALAGSMLILVMAFNELGKTNTIGTAASMIVIATALVILSQALKTMGSLKIEELVTALAALAGSMLVLVMVFTELGKTNTLGTAVSMVVMAASLVILSEALKTMGSLKVDELVKSLVALAGSMIIIVAAFKMINPAQAAGVAASMLLMASSLSILSKVMESFGSMSMAEIGKSLLMLAASLAVIGGMSALLAPVIPAIIGLSVALALLGVAALGVGAGIMALSIGLTTLAGASVATISAIVASLEILFVGILDIISRSVTKIGEVVKNVILTVLDVIVECAPAIAEAVFQLVLESLTILSDYVPPIVEKLLDFVIGLIDALAAKAPDLIKSIVNLVQQVINGVIAALKDFKVDDMEGVLENALMIGAFLAALGVYAALAPAAMVGVLALAGLVAEVAAVLALLGGLSYIPGLQWFIDKGGELLEHVGTAIGKFVGGFVGGAMEGISASLPDMANNLSKFMLNLTPFLVGAAAIDPSMMEGVEALCKVVLLITAANILDGLSKWLTGGTSLAKFGEELAQFGPKFAQYAKSVKDIDPETVTASANAALALAQMADTLPNSGGLAGKIFGENNLSEFGEELSKFGPYISEYAASVKGVDPGAVQASVEAAQMLSDMATKLPNQGGIVSWFTGDNTLTMFGEELAEFGPYISEYAGKVSGVTPGAVQASVEAAQMLADMAATLPNQGGMVSWFTGDNTLSVFGTELEAFGPSIKAYADSIAGVDATAVTASANAAKALSELASNLPNQGGLVSIFTGDNDISKFGKSLEKFGAAFSKYYSYVSGISPEVLNSVSTAVATIIALAKEVNGLDPKALTNFATDLEGMGKKGIDGFVTAFSKAGPKIQNAVKTLIATAKSTISAQIPSMRNSSSILGTAMIDGVNTGIINRKSVLLSAVKTLCTTIVTQMKTDLAVSIFSQIGQTIVQGIMNGINLKKPTLMQMVKTLCQNVITGFKSGLNAEALRPVGVAIIEGIIKGLKDSSETLKEAAKSLSNALTTSLKSVLNENTFKPIGAAAANGIKQGLTDKINEIAKAATDAAKKAVTEAEKALGGSSSTKSKENSTQAVQAYVDAVESADDQIRIDATRTAQTVAQILSATIASEIGRPVIRPVLDLSDVTLASSEIQNGLNAMVSMRLASAADNYNSINTLSNLTSSLEKIESEGNENIIGAIRDLRTDVNTLNANMSRLQVVLDSGALIGELAPGMDAKLGNIAKLKSRGV